MRATSPPLTAADSRRRRLRDARRLARRYRRWMGVGMVGLALLLTLTALAPPPPPTVEVAVAARDLAAGTWLSSDDIASVQAPTTLAPAPTITPRSLVGQVLAGPVTAGEHLTATRLRGSGLLVGTPSGTVALPVRVADAGAVSLVSTGDRVDLLATVTTEEGTRVTTVGSDLAVVLAAGASQADADAALTPVAVGAGADPLSGLLVVAATPSQVTSIVAGAAESPLWLVVRRQK